MSENRKITILVADDSLFMRNLIKDLLSGLPGIEVVGEAKNGEEAVQQALELKPDVITMDYHMPLMNGAKAISQILNSSDNYKPGILMLSAYTKEGAQETLECLKAGAIDFIAKPSGEVSLSLKEIQDSLIMKIHAAFHAKPNKVYFEESKPDKSIQPSIKLPKKDIVVIGASTGGPPLIENIVTSLPANFPAAVIVDQHMPKYFTEAFAERLNRISEITVREAKEGDHIHPGEVLIVPGNALIDITPSKKIKLTPEKEHGPLTTISALFSSAAKQFEDSVLAVVLTGMGEDGLDGAKKIKEHNGHIIVQDPTTTIVDSMPTAIISHELADQIIPPNEIVKQIIKLCSK